MTENAAPLPSIPERHYPRSPLVEALCEIYFTGSRWDATTPGLFYERVRGDYPQKSEMAMVGVEVQVTPGQAETRSLPVEPRMRFARDDGSRLLRLSRDLLVVNQLLPYTRYEEWREVVHTARGVYRQLAEPAGIDRLGVRYINRVNVPGSGIRMEDYFRVYPEVPQELGEAHGPFLLQLLLHSVCRGHQLTLTLGLSLPQQPGTTSVLLDLYDVMPRGGETPSARFGACWTRHTRTSSTPSKTPSPARHGSFLRRRTMIEILPLEASFRHVSTRDLVAPLLSLFYSATRAGRENSVVLREQAMVAPPEAATLSAREQGFLDKFSADCRQAVSFAQRIVTGQVEAPSPDLLALARQAAQQCAARKDEDVQAWADRLARDVGSATD
jgi:uncharacterized protein (TIGR04255 family)